MPRRLDNRVQMRFAFLLISAPIAAAGFDRASIEQAEWAEQTRGALNPVLIKAQILLDRARFSSGEIDGKLGENVKKAISAFATTQGLASTGQLRCSGVASQGVTWTYGGSDDHPGLDAQRVAFCVCPWVVDAASISSASSWNFHIAGAIALLLWIVAVV